MVTRALPTGTVTFLFTDVESSTRLWESYPEAMRAALARHDVLIEQAVEATYGDNYKRLASVKAKYDPGNMSRVNQNILPAAA